MTQNDTKKFKWDVARERAAAFLAEGRLTDEDIADSLGVSRASVARWKTYPDFAARVNSLVADAREAVRRQGIANRQNRVDALNNRWLAMQSVIEQRAKEYANVSVGGNTGLIVRQTKGIGKGEDFEIVEEYAVDTGLLRELREHEKQAAQELGQWTEKREHSFDLSDLSNEELQALARIRAKLTT